MTGDPPRLLASSALVAGSALGIAGSLSPSPAWRGLAWGLDGTALVIAGALLAVHHVRRGNELAAAGFLVFVAGQTLVLSSAAMTIEASTPSFSAGVALWAAALVLVSLSTPIPALLKGLGLLAALLFAVVAVRIFMGEALTPLSQPLPALAFPLLAATLCGWGWMHYRGAGLDRTS